MDFQRSYLRKNVGIKQSKLDFMEIFSFYKCFKFQPLGRTITSNTFKNAIIYHPPLKQLYIEVKIFCCALGYLYIVDTCDEQTELFHYR